MSCGCDLGVFLRQLIFSCKVYFVYLKYFTIVSSIRPICRLYRTVTRVSMKFLGVQVQYTDIVVFDHRQIYKTYKLRVYGLISKVLF